MEIINAYFKIKNFKIKNSKWLQFQEKNWFFYIFSKFSWEEETFIENHVENLFEIYNTLEIGKIKQEHVSLFFKIYSTEANCSFSLDLQSLKIINEMWQNFDLSVISLSDFVKNKIREDFYNEL